METFLFEQLDHIFNPTSVAMIGASERFGSWGFGIMNRVLAQPGRKIYPVNEKAPEICGLRAYRNITEIPDEVEFAIIAIPTPRIPAVMKECVEKGVKAALIISGGLAESSEEGKRIEQEILKIAREGGLRFIGPNSMGHADTSSNFSTLSWIKNVTKGPIGFISQSGTYGHRISRIGMRAGIGFSKFINSGNEADLHLEDFLEYLARDEETKIILAYIEGLREGKRFFRLAREITKQKPIIVMKAGRSEMVAKAVKSHSAALIGSDLIYDALFKQSGVIRVRDDDEVFDVAAALLHLPLPKGKRIGILTEGGGIGVVATDDCLRQGLELSSYSPATLKKLDGFLPPYWSRGNPTDMTDANTLGRSATFDCLSAILEDENVDMVLWIGGIGASVYFSQTIGISTLMKDVHEKVMQSTEAEEQAGIDMISRKMFECQKPVVFSRLIPKMKADTKAFSALWKRGVPVYPSPRRAAKVLHHLVSYSEYLNASQ